ncbi:MAG TPA: Hsp20/alpha crystallin family protein [Candidatus Binatia bacterium]|nr:Hsp20/alpha crystallin family protein [Candidatus Binatia bacterium]
MKNINQKLPVRVHRADGRITVAAPMPGLSPDEINITIMENAVLLRGEKQGSGEPDLDLIVNEWAAGPYAREITLPDPVRGDLANATYGNGVLVLSLPTVKKGDKSVRASFQLQPVSATRGERIGHTGREIHPMTTDEHLKKHGKASNRDSKKARSRRHHRSRRRSS